MAEALVRHPASLRRPAVAAGYCWRGLAIAFCFALFGIGSIALGTIAVPLGALASRDPALRLRRVRSAIGAALRFFIVVLRRSGLMTYDVEGLENIVAGRSYVIVANHPTLLDAVFLLAQFPMADCVIKEAMARNPFTRRLARAADYIPNSDPVALLESAVARLKAGRSLILFPEGTRTEPGRPLRFKAGAAAIALRSGRDCLPVVIRGDPPALGKSDRWYHIPPRRVHFSLSVHAPMSPVRGLDAAQRGAHRSFNRRLEAWFAARLGGSR